MNDENTLYTIKIQVVKANNDYGHTVEVLVDGGSKGCYMSNCFSFELRGNNLMQVNCKIYYSNSKPYISNAVYIKPKENNSLIVNLSNSLLKLSK